MTLSRHSGSNTRLKYHGHHVSITAHESMYTKGILQAIKIWKLLDFLVELRFLHRTPPGNTTWASSSPLPTRPPSLHHMLAKRNTPGSCVRFQLTITSFCGTLYSYTSATHPLSESSSEVTWFAERWIYGSVAIPYLDTSWISVISSRLANAA